MTFSTTISDHDLINGTPRVQRLREVTAMRAVHSVLRMDPECELAAARSWLASCWELSPMVRRGRMAGEILRAMTPVIANDELLVGKYAGRALTEEEQAELLQWQQSGFLATLKAGGQRAHMAIDYTRLLRSGVAGIRAQLAAYRAQLNLADPTDMEKDAFYRGCLEALDGLVALSQQYADLAEQQAETVTDPSRQAELREIARICRKVPEHPAETFHEAIQAAHFVTFCMCAGNQMWLFQLGRPDRYLLPFYRRDLTAGRITPERAQELIDCLGLLLNDYTPRGLAVGYMVGGRDEYGNDVTNELSYMLVRAIGHIRLSYPASGICWTPDTPADLLALAARLLARGYSHPALFNDDVITRGLLQQGLSHRDACVYIHSTCVEITPAAISNVYVASPYYSLMQALHDVLGIPPQGGEPGTMPVVASMDDLTARFQTRVRAMVAQGTAAVNTEMMSRRYGGGFPLLSCFVNDCLAQGKDIDQGGARCNWIEVSFVGLANVVDALAAIRQYVYEQKRFTLADLRAALLADFDGYAEIQALLDRAPKYGMDHDEVDGLIVTLTDFLREVCAAHQTYWGGPVLPGFFCWQMHEMLGRQCCASADGRTAGFPFADGSGPAQGRERLGPTAAVRSATKWDHSAMLGGVAVNMRFSPRPNPDDLATPLQQVMETFLQLGGFETQINVVSTATLRDAQAHPEQYRDLVVRIAGYSDYFVGLTPEMQAEVIMRAAMEL